MTVNVTKSSFNFREKLKELERPIGLKGNELMRAETAQDARDLVSAGRKNTIINGNFDVWQRGTSISGNQHTYGADRWQGYGYSGSSMTMSRQTFSAAEQEKFGSRYYCRITETNDRCWFTQLIEDPIQFIGNFVTVSFWAKTSDLVGVEMQIEFRFYDAAANKVYSADSYQSYTPEFDEVYTSEWKKYTYTVYVPPTSSWSGTTTDTEVRLTVTTPNSNPGSIDFANVQVELGKNATEFEHRSYGEELALCQRYYQKSDTLTPGPWFYDARLGASYYRTTVFFPTEMRDTPTVTWSVNGSLGATYGTQFITRKSFTPYTNTGSNSLYITSWTAEKEL